MLASFAVLVDSQGLIRWDTVATSAIDDTLHQGNAIELIVVKVFCKGIFLVVLAVLLDSPGDVHEDRSGVRFFFQESSFAILKLDVIFSDGINLLLWVIGLVKSMLVRVPLLGPFDWAEAYV